MPRMFTVADSGGEDEVPLRQVASTAPLATAEYDVETGVAPLSASALPPAPQATQEKPEIDKKVKVRGDYGFSISSSKLPL